LRSILDLDGGPQRTRSDGERAMLRLLRSNKIYGFKANARRNGYEVDFLWSDLSFCVELDSWDAHSSRQAFERDRLKWAELDAGGVSVMPVTGRQLATDSTGVIERLLPALRHRGYPG
jgi:very-short-patch-repair endonuclease